MILDDSLERWEQDFDAVRSLELGSPGAHHCSSAIKAVFTPAWSETSQMSVPASEHRICHFCC